jgi:hypothetical protein
VKRYLAAQKETRRAQLAAAEALQEIEVTRHWSAVDMASLSEFGSRHGSSGAEVATLLRVHQAVTARPDLKEDLIEGRISLEAVAALRDVVLDPTLQHPGEDLIALAAELPARQIARIVRRRVAERREGGPVVEVTVHLGGKDRDNLERARVVASRKANRMLNQSETVATALKTYLDVNDPRCVTPGTRRMPDTRGRPGRAVPEEVSRALDFQFAGRCAVPHCEHMVWTHRAHLLAKWRGGSQELDNLILLCPRHHKMLDRGQISIVGEPGRRRFMARGGTDLGSLDGEPRPKAASDRPRRPKKPPEPDG